MRYEDFDAEETLEMEDKDIEKITTHVDLNITESLGIWYEVPDNEYAEVEGEGSSREKPDGFTVIICWLGLAYTGLHTIYSAKSK